MSDLTSKAMEGMDMEALKEALRSELREELTRELLGEDSEEDRSEKDYPWIVFSVDGTEYGVNSKYVLSIVSTRLFILTIYLRGILKR